MQRNRILEQYLLVGLVLVYFFWMNLGVVQPVLLGLFLALVMSPLQNRLTRASHASHEGPTESLINAVRGYGLSSGLAATLLTLGLVVLVILPLTYIAVVVTKDAATLSTTLANIKGEDWTTAQTQAGPGDDFNFLGFVKGLYERVSGFLPLSEADLQEALKAGATRIAGFSAQLLGSVAASLPKMGMESVIFVMALFFGLSDGAGLAQMLKDLLPFDPKEVELFASTTEKVTRGVVVGSLISGITQGLLIGFGYGALGVPRGLFFGTMTAICSFIPFVGAIPAGIGGAIYLFAHGRTGAAIGMMIVFAISSTSDNIVKPLALRGQSAMHPLLAFISVLGGLSLFGVAGLFLGPVIAALTLASLDLLIRSGFEANSAS